MTSNVQPLKRTEPIIVLDRQTAPLMMELMSKAVTGAAQAHLLAHLYAQVKAAVKCLEIPPGSEDET